MDLKTLYEQIVEGAGVSSGLFLIALALWFLVFELHRRNQQSHTKAK